MKQSPVVGGGWSGLGGLAHSSCQLSLPCTPNSILRVGGRESLRDIQGLRAKPPHFIAGELEICFSLPVLGKWILRGSQEEEVTSAVPTLTDGHARPTLGKCWGTSGPWEPRIHCLLLCTPCSSRRVSSNPPQTPKQGPQAQTWASGAEKWAVHQRSNRIFYWKKSEIWGDRQPGKRMF